MANRVLLGQRGSEMGLWVSKPGYDVLTTAERNMLFLATPSRAIRALQIVQTGLIQFPANVASIDVGYPFQGYIPMIVAYFGDGNATFGVTMTFPNIGVLRFTRQRTDVTSDVYRYFITSMKANG
ncbi:hypothetical protein SAMN05216358_0003 [Rhizobium sp. AN5]|uniref:hypothetical protein n=1 Tax=Rhizobium sp. AN5 TaxID=1855304 RepID=UPI000BD1F515|nr:hypothetical protein [Rhizobium sp. AN5]SOC89987.1 hypothetical protein SAMN05216358_0003 [Rhizobium sp. AN5]